ncbi:gamma-butyrobetaine hydroxylase-like domain-containing protein [Microvirga sp. 2MCAF38]|uniref:gamma-butyrobetaine hydroxylase-like domain-containing protein n=1 Tax=Microvirga sp. 2MCAF38 TaxID=3232989 RepID=UPI003F9555F2
MSSDRWPTEIRLSKDKRTLHVAFDNGEAFDLTAEYLRIASPSAEVQGHSPAERKTVPGKQNVEIMKIDPVGNYAVKLTFDDMHDTGIYGWGYLHELGRDQTAKWETYLDDLAAKGLSRDPLRR